ncbi:hypothetical protein BKA66DRAFT_573773 [Pyrenochaeta sp. MPI-SDFR-AT-0127]|nr:hypothetical protein BKA66DRAFT_573773 [Pyrenochaeta sp. MPI-SDFR-AT-0127]
MSNKSENLFSKSALADTLHLTRARKCATINALWPHLNLVEQDYIEDDYAALFEFFGRTLQGLHPHSSKFAIQEWSGLFDISASLSANRSVAREALIGDVKKRYLNTEDAAIARSIELVVRLWLGLNICSKGLSVGPANPRESRIDWEDGQSFNALVATQFPQGPSKGTATNVQFDDSFTAVNLKSICRLHLRWTDNLTDHLKLEGPRGQRSLSIYQHKICLVNHWKATETALIPTDILDETIRTLDLLFPFGDPKTNAFLEEEDIQFWSISRGLSETSRATKLDEFRYWRSRLAQLSNLFHGPPETVMQTLLDTRNITQFATLWVAIFGVFFLTIIFGVLSTVYSVKQYRVAMKSYELALAQACQQASKPLQGFCD